MTSREQARAAAPISVGAPRRILKARKDRREAEVKDLVRADCVERDGYCISRDLDPCSGPSEWMHLKP